MSQDNQTAVQPELTKEEISAQVDAFRDGIVALAVDANLSFNVVFAAIAQVSATFLFDFLLLTKGELSPVNVAEAIEKFNAQVEKVTQVGFENMIATAKQDAAGVPKIITEI